MGATDRTSTGAVPAVAGTQTLLRGLAVLECVADGVIEARDIATRLGTERSTTHRMLASLVAAGYLHHIPFVGYSLGPKLIRLGAQALEARPIIAIARPHLERLARETGDTVHLGVTQGADVLYLDKIPSTRGLEMRSRVGNRMPLALTGVGKALMLGEPNTRWRALYDDGRARVAADAKPLAWDAYVADLDASLARGWVTDREENELGIRCVGAVVRDVTGAVVAAVSVASAVSHMPEARMAALGPVVAATAVAISRDLGWTE